MATIHLSQDSLHFLLDVAIDHCERNLPTYLFIGANSSEENPSVFKYLFGTVPYRQSISKVIQSLNKNQSIHVSLLLSTVSGSYFLPKTIYNGDTFQEVINLANIGCKFYIVNNINPQCAEFSFGSTLVKIEDE